MLSFVVPLDSKIEQTTVNGNTVFNVSEGYLLCCFDNDVPDKTIVEIANRHPIFVVLCDSCFASDSVADNVEQIFKSYSPDTICKVI